MCILCGYLYWYCNGLEFRVVPMNWQEFTALLVLATAMSFSPGPNTTLSTALAANRGLRRAMRFVLAVPVGWTCCWCSARPAWARWWSRCRRCAGHQGARHRLSAVAGLEAQRAARSSAAPTARACESASGGRGAAVRQHQGLAAGADAGGRLDRRAAPTPGSACRRGAGDVSLPSPATSPTRGRRAAARLAGPGPAPAVVQPRDGRGAGADGVRGWSR